MIPRKWKLAHTAYVAVLVPAYWRHYGPGNFLWFSDVALIGMVPALWREDRRLLSMLALSALLPEVPWNLDYFTRLFTGRKLLGLSNYMFEAKNPRWIRALSWFHVWMPPLLAWSVRRLGYDRRALASQILGGEAVLVASYWLTPPAENVNWVYGPGAKPQGKVPRTLYLAGVIVFFPLCIWWPTHRALQRLRGPAPAAVRGRTLAGRRGT